MNDLGIHALNHTLVYLVQLDNNITQRLGTCGRLKLKVTLENLLGKSSGLFAHEVTENSTRQMLGARPICLGVASSERTYDIGSRISEPFRK